MNKRGILETSIFILLNDIKVLKITPSRTGINIKKAKSLALLLSIPLIKAPHKQDPLREIPGMAPKHWNKPIVTASLQFILSLFVFTLLHMFKKIPFITKHNPINNNDDEM